MKVLSALSPNAQRMVDLLELLTSQFIRYPAPATVQVLEMSHKINIAIRPHADDYGKLIGAQGVMFKAMSTILEIAGQKWAEVKYAILQPTVGVEELIKPKFQLDPRWTSKRVVETMKAAMQKILPNFEWQVFVTDTEDITGLKLIYDGADQATMFEEELSKALSVVFYAIGKAQGRNEILVEVTSKANDRSPINRG